MQTSLYQIKLKDGSMFNVFCANKKQNKDMLWLITYASKHNKLEFKTKVIAKGIHTMQQFIDIINDKLTQ